MNGIPHWRKYTIERTCKCGKKYQAYTYNLKRGWSLHCSISCARRGTKINRTKGVSEEARQKISATLKAKYKSGELVSPLRRLGLIGLRREKAMHWQGGKALQGQGIRNTADYRDWRVAVLKRDNFTCRFCKKRGGKLQADHRIPVSERRDLILDATNGRTLCVDCHRRVTFGWKPFKTDFRRAFMDGLIKLAETDKRLLFITCDVGFSFVEQWKEKYPDRFFNFGVTEQSTAIISAAMALDGLRPVFYSMINFVLYRPYEMIRNAVGYHDAPVLLAGVQGSAKYKMLGFSHSSTKNEDVNLIDHIPNMRIYIPMKDSEVLPMLAKIFSEKHPSYMRL